MIRNILVTGSKGQLGSEIMYLSKKFPDLNFLFTDIDELDLSKPEDVEAFFIANQIDACINCAAYTAVDKAEDDRELAMLVNHTAVEYLAKTCEKYNSLLIHISTDYVFSGKHYKPYMETDSVSPESYYGESKLKGEEAVLGNCKKSVVIRTSWLYSSYGSNFVHTMIRLGMERDSLGVVADQVGTPTYAADLAMAIMSVITGYDNKREREIYHFSNEGAISWYDFAKAIFELSGMHIQVNPIKGEFYPTKATRPFYSVMSKEKIKKEFSIEIPYWRDSLKRCLSKL